MYELRGLFIQIRSNRKSIDSGLIMQKSFFVKMLYIEGEDLLLMIPELYISVVSCFRIKVITKNMALFQFCIYFGILVLLNQKNTIPLCYHVQASFINKEDKYLYR